MVQLGSELDRHFPAHPGARSIIDVEVARISDSCGYGVPKFGKAQPREALDMWTDKKGAAGLAAYRRQKNARSIDGLPALGGEDDRAAQPGRRIAARALFKRPLRARPRRCPRVNAAPLPECLSRPVPAGRDAEAEFASFIAHLWELLSASLAAHRHLALCARRAEREGVHQRRAMAFEELGQAIASTERLVRQMEALALRDLQTAGSFGGLPRP